jgi:hypothetical protein
VGFGDKQMDVMSRLLSDRILLLGSQVDDERGNVLVAQLLYLSGEDALGAKVHRPANTAVKVIVLLLLGHLRTPRV